jgi:hypothetical protein
MPADREQPSQEQHGQEQHSEEQHWVAWHEAYDDPASRLSDRVGLVTARAAKSYAARPE